MKIKIFIVVALLLGLGACSSGYFRDGDTTQYLGEDRKNELLQDPGTKAKIVLAELNSLYSLLIQFDLNGNTSHDFFGLKSIMLATDLTGEDMVQVTHHWFGFDYNIDNRQATYRRTRLMWAFFYKMVSVANGLNDKYLSDENLTTELKAIKAQVLSARGIAYYYLVNLYQQTYVGSQTLPGVPLVLTSADADKPRATVEEVYTQIIKDLTYGVENGAYTADEKKDVDKKVAAAYLAKTYAAQEQWAKAEEYAAIAIDGLSVSESDNFFRLTNSDVLWGYDINATTSTSYASFFSQIDNTIGGYAGGLAIYKSIHNKLFEQIYSDDIRRSWFVSAGNPYGGLPNYANIKFKSLPDFSGDYIYIRSADPYLIYVEAQAAQGKTADAMNALGKFLAQRGVPASEIPAGGTALRDYIRLQRRIELWGEGTSFFDLKRWKLPITRDVAGTNHRTKKNVAAGAVDFVYMIPQAEIERNSNLVQNP